MSKSMNLESLHKEYITDVAGEVVMDSKYEGKLWNLNQGDKIELNSSSYKGSETLIKYNLQFIVLRGPVEGHWAYRPFDPKELNLMFYAKDYPEVAHSWSLYEEDREDK